MPHLWKLLLFVTLSLADLVLTWMLVSHSQGKVYESNPIAESWLALYGWVGLIIFKASIVFIVLCLTYLIGRYRPRLAGLVLSFGCCAVAIVVGYSCYLVRQQAKEGMVNAATKLEDENRAVEQTRILAFSILRDHLSDDLLAGRRGLRDAVEQLSQTDKVHEEPFRRSLSRIYQGRSDEERLAVSLIKNAVEQADGNPQTVQRTTRRLAREFQETYHVPMP